MIHRTPGFCTSTIDRALCNHPEVEPVLTLNLLEKKLQEIQRTVKKKNFFSAVP